MRLVGQPCHDWDCPQQTVSAAEYAALKDRFERMIDYSIDLQRIIEDLCYSREIKAPETAARWHYDMALTYRASLTPKPPVSAS